MTRNKAIKSSIGRRLILYVVLFSSFLTLIITAFQLFRDYNADLEQIDTDLVQIEKVHLESLTSALWASNTKLLQTSIEGILKIRDIQYVEIFDEQKTWAKAGEVIGQRNIQKKFSMDYVHRNKEINIGYLIVDVSLDGVYQRLYDKVFVILISNAIKTSLVALFILFLFHRLVARHLSAISEFSRNHDPLSNNAELTLNRNGKNYDEFDVVVESINEMHSRLNEQLLEIDQQKQYLAQTLNSIGDAVITTDVMGNVSRMNPVAETLTGWKYHEVKGQSLKSVFKIIDASTRLKIENPVDKVIGTGETVYLSNHTTLINKSGREYQIADSAAAIRDGENILGMVLVFNDVTEQYQLREAAAKSEKKYHTLTTIAPVGIFHTDAQGNCLYVNEKWCEIVGMTSDEAMGEGWIRGLHSEDRKRIETIWEHSAKTGKAFKLEYRFQRTDSVRWVLGLATAEIDSDGSIIGYIGTITDITERKLVEEALIESESKLRLIHSQVPGVVYQLKIDVYGKRTFPYVSSAVEMYTGLKADDVMNDAETFFSLSHPDDLSELEKSIFESMQSLNIWRWKGRCIREDGKTVWLSGISTPERLKDGSTLWNGLFVDITERVQSDEIIRRTQKMDALGKLTGGIAHDYNNMLGVVLGYSSLLAEMLDDKPQLKTYAEKITHAGERGAKLTKKLLAFSKNNSTDVKVFNMNRLLREEQHMLEKTLTASISLEFKLPSDLWLVNLDESELEDAILNMSINAMHAIEGNGSLIIETRNQIITSSMGSVLGLDAGEYVCLGLHDTGKGMDESIKDRVFDPFFSTKGKKGTGLGLSQVYGFVHRSGGVITVDSTIDQGTKFTLYFPRYQGKEENLPVSAAKNNLELKGKGSILVVDDEEALLTLTCEILIKQGYNVYRAEEAKQALEMLKTIKIDLLISDIIMPDMNGYALADAVKAEYPSVKIQLMSGYTGDERVDKVDETLSKNLLHKPFNAQALLKITRDLLS